MTLPQTPIPAELLEGDLRSADGRAEARELAERHGLEYVDLDRFRIESDLFHSIPLELMLRYGFLPQQQLAGRLAIVMTDPTDVGRCSTSSSCCSARRSRCGSGTPAAIDEILQKSRVVAARARGGDRGLPASSSSPRTKTARRCCRSTASPPTRRRSSSWSTRRSSTPSSAAPRDIHIETRDTEVVIKYRIDGVLYQAMEPIDKRHHQTDHQPHQGHVRARHRREARAPGRPLQAAAQGADDRLPRLDHAVGARRGRGDPHPRQGVDERGVHATCASTSSASTRRPCASCASSSASPTAWCW